MKIVKYALLVIIGLPLAAAAIIALVNIPDADPSLELQAVQARQARHDDGKQQEQPRRSGNNAYYYLLGFAAPPGREPAGAARVSVRRHNALADGDHREVSLRELEGNLEGLALEGEPQDLCKTPGEACLPHFERHAARYAALVRDNALLLERYRSLIGHEFYRAAVKPSLLEPYMPRPGVLQHAQLLFLYQVAVDHAADTGPLERDLVFWRMVLARTDILVDKMLAAHMIERNVSLQDEMADRYGTRHTRSLSLLRAREADLDAVLWRELDESLWMVDQLARYPVDLYPDTFEWLINSPVGGHFFKPTATKNLATAFYFEVIDILNGEPETRTDRFAALERRFERRTGGIGRLYNPVGKYFFVGDTGHFTRTAARLLDLEGYLALLVLKRRIRGDNLAAHEIRERLAQVPGSLRNPYNGAPMQYDAARRALYFEPPAGTRERVAVRLDGAAAARPPRYHGRLVSRRAPAVGEPR